MTSRSGRKIGFTGTFEATNLSFDIGDFREAQNAALRSKLPVLSQGAQVYDFYEGFEKSLKNPIARFFIRKRVGAPKLEMLQDFVMSGMRWYDVICQIKFRKVPIRRLAEVRYLTELFRRRM